jgi:hypothetical protein
MIQYEPGHTWQTVAHELIHQIGLVDAEHDQTNWGLFTANAEETKVNIFSDIDKERICQGIKDTIKTFGTADPITNGCIVQYDPLCGNGNINITHNNN